MIKLITTICMALCVLNSYTQEFSTHWISYPLPNDSSEVLFCHTYKLKECPQEAYLTFASCGHLRIYVNERNISKDITFTNLDMTHLAIQTYNITPLMHSGDNCISVWYAPAEGCAISKQLSLEFYGTKQNGETFYHQANRDWLCQILKGSFIKEGRETFDSRYYDHNWKSNDYNRRHWLHPLGAYWHDKSYTATCNMFSNENTRLQYVFKPVEIRSNSNLLELDLNRTTKGTLRLTLRGAHKGETVHINDFTYICNGEMDEQAFCRFAQSESRTVSVKGNQDFKTQHITNVEFLEF